MKSVKNEEKNKWKIVLIKTIEGKEPIFYRIVNLYDYSIRNIPAHRILDEVINKKKNIINLKCENNSVIILNEDGYESTDEVIIVDEFDNEIPNLFDWAIKNEGIGTKILSRFDSVKNAFSPSNFKVDSENKIAWTCEKGHTIYCGFTTYFSTKCNCPICSMEENGETPSLSYWAHITNNLDILKEYEEAEKNKEYSTEINWKSRKKVWFKRGDEEVPELLNNVTIKGIEPPFSNGNKRVVVNLSR